MTDLTKLSAAELGRRLAAKDVSAVEVATAHLDRIEAVEAKVHAFLYVDREGALAAKRAIERFDRTVVAEQAEQLLRKPQSGVKMVR